MQRTKLLKLKLRKPIVLLQPLRAQPFSTGPRSKGPISQPKNKVLSTTKTNSFSTGLGLSPEPYPTVYNPKWWMGSFPDTIDPKEIVFDCKGKLPTPDENFKNQVAEVFDRKGIVWVQNTGAQTLTELQDHVDLVLEEKRDYKGGANARGNLEASFYEVGAPACADLHYHHEMSYVSQSTTRLCFTIIDVLD